MLVTQIKIPLRPIAVPIARFSLTLASVVKIKQIIKTQCHSKRKIKPRASGNHINHKINNCKRKNRDDDNLIGFTIKLFQYNPYNLILASSFLKILHHTYHYHNEVNVLHVK